MRSGNVRQARIPASLTYAAYRQINADGGKMRFEWDEHKNLLNIRNHKIDFRDVSEMFLGPIVMDIDDREDYEELRWIGIGLLHEICVVVIFTERDENIIRLISARKANQKERTAYEQHIKNKLGIT